MPPSGTRDAPKTEDKEGESSRPLSTYASIWTQNSTRPMRLRRKSPLGSWKTSPGASLRTSPGLSQEDW